MRDLSTKKDNLNLFVGDQRYKTNFFLQFYDRSTKILYEKHSIESCGYSARLMLGAMWVSILFILSSIELPRTPSPTDDTFS